MVITKGDINNIEEIVHFIQNRMEEVPEMLKRQYQMLYGDSQMVMGRVKQDIEHMVGAWENDSCVGVLSAITSTKQAELLRAESIIYLFTDRNKRNQHIAGNLLDYYLNNSGNNIKISTTLPFMEKRMTCLFVTRNFKTEGYINNGSEKYDNIILGKLL